MVNTTRTVAFFPTPFKDELIYSVISRYHLVTANPSTSSTAKELLCRQTAVKNMELFSLARILNERLSHFKYISTEKIIKNHTFYNYYARFLSELDRHEFYKLMLGGTSGEIKNIYKNKIRDFNPMYYQFCIKCFTEEIEAEVPYWHMSHNLPGVKYCFKHDYKLSISNVLFNAKKYEALTEAMLDGSSLLIDFNEKDEKILKQITNLSAAFINKDDFIFRYRTKYLLYLNKGNYIEDANLKSEKLITDFINFFSKEICEVIKINPEIVIQDVLNSLKQYAYNIPPLYHILFLIFCDKGLEEIFETDYIDTSISYYLDKNIQCKCTKIFTSDNSKLKLGFTDSIEMLYKCSCGNTYEYDSKINKLEVYSKKQFKLKLWKDILKNKLTDSEICEKYTLTKNELIEAIHSAFKKKVRF